MNKKFMISIIVMCLLFAGSTTFLWADDDDDDRGKDKKGNWLSSWFDDDDDDDHDEGKRSRLKNNGSLMAPVMASIPAAPPEFEVECGSCHMAYQPELLNVISWTKIMDGLEDHFGEDASIDPATHQILLAHLNRFSIEKSNSRSSRKMMRSMGKSVYMRISDVPRLKREHSEHISSLVISSPKIKSIANCGACHTTAPQGEYDEDYVRIPR